jgi:tRNA threonylcarbamoyl adenosine modification protein (Sua5/YciO/YrdC/YwlC family)
MIKAHTPGAYTFVLPATKEVPRRLQHPKRKTIGLRVPDNTIALALLEELNEPLMSSTLILPNEDMPMTDAEDIADVLGKQVDLVIDGGFCGAEPTTVIEFIDDMPEVIRVGLGDATPFEG